MRKFLVGFSVLGLAAAALVAFSSYGKGQFAQRVNPGSNLIELTPSVTTGNAVSGIAPLPVGKSIKTMQRLLGLTKVTAAPSGGAGATLDVYYQYSADDGMTWQDFANVHVAQATGTFLVPVSVITAGPTSVPTAADGSLASNTIVQGPLGDKIRVKYSASLGSSTGNWTFQSFVAPD